jgi:uncharacterized protein (TIGR03089 family)
MTTASPSPATSPSHALAQRLQSDPASPLITYYDPATGERIEVSAVTFANWVAKTANLLRDGLGSADSPRVLIDLRPHWQTLVVAHAVWGLGGCVHLISTPDGRVDVAFTALDRADEAAAQADDVVVLALRSMALPGDPVPPPAWDFDREVKAFGDRFQGPRIDPGAPALVTESGHSLSHAELIARSQDLAEQARSTTGHDRVAIDGLRVHRDVAVVAALIAIANASGIVIGADALSESVLDQERAKAWEPAPLV